MTPSLNEMWGPFRVRLWIDPHVPAEDTLWRVEVHEGGVRLLRGKSPHRAALAAGTSAALEVLAVKRGLRLKPWRVD